MRTTGGKEVESYTSTLDLLAKSHWEKKRNILLFFIAEKRQANLTLEITLEQFLIVQESEYLQWLLSAQLFH